MGDRSLPVDAASMEQLAQQLVLGNPEGSIACLVDVAKRESGKQRVEDH